VEGKSVEAGLGDLLFGGVCKLCLESCKEVEVGVLDVVIDWVKLFKSFEDSFDPSVHLGSFDECECYHNVPYWGFEAQYSLVFHHVDSEFSYKHICASPISVE